jgi:hypothetical protein
MLILRATLGIVLLAGMAGACEANPLDDCTLKNMAGVTSDAAAKMVRQACLGQISAPIGARKMGLGYTVGQGLLGFSVST